MHYAMVVITLYFLKYEAFINAQVTAPALPSNTTAPQPQSAGSGDYSLTSDSVFSTPITGYPSGTASPQSPTDSSDGGNFRHVKIPSTAEIAVPLAVLSLPFIGWYAWRLYRDPVPVPQYRPGDFALQNRRDVVDVEARPMEDPGDTATPFDVPRPPIGPVQAASVTAPITPMARCTVDPLYAAGAAGVKDISTSRTEDFDFPNLSRNENRRVAGEGPRDPSHVAESSLTKSPPDVPGTRSSADLAREVSFLRRRLEQVTGRPVPEVLDLPPVQQVETSTDL